MTVAELHPAHLWGLIISGTAVGVYAPMAYVRMCREHWDEWPIQTKAFAWIVAGILGGGTIASTLFMLNS